MQYIHFINRKKSSWHILIELKSLILVCPVDVPFLLLVQELLQQEREMRQHANKAWSKLLSECKSLHGRLKKCSMNFSPDDDYNHDVESSSLSNALDLLTTSDDQLNLLLAEVSNRL